MKKDEDEMMVDKDEMMVDGGMDMQPLETGAMSHKRIGSCKEGRYVFGCVPGKVWNGLP